MNTVHLTFEENLKSPWGFWQTLGISVTIFIASILITTTFNLVIHYTKTFHDFFTQYQGLLKCIDLIIVAASIVTFTILITRSRMPNTFKCYLGLKLPTKKQTLIFLFAAVIIRFVGHFLSIAFGMSQYYYVVINLLKTSGYPALTFIVLVFVIPVCKELLFRGFMFPGIENSKLGSTGAIIFISVLGTLSSFNYGISQVISDLLVNIFLGFTRHRTKSIYLTMMINSFITLIGFVVVLYRAGIIHLGLL